MNKQRSGKRNLKYFTALFVIPVLLCFFTSCDKNSGLGSNVLPSGDILGAYVTDTTTVVSSIKLKDSVLTNSAALYQLGSYYDPVFGMTKASFYTQVVFPGDNSSFGFGTGPYTLDSVVLALPFNDGAAAAYGYLTPQTFTVDTLTSPLVVAKAYYSDTTISHGNNHIGVETITPNPYDSARITYGINYRNQIFWPEIRIKLNNSFGNYIMNADPSYFQSTANFQTLLKGLYVSVSNPGQLPGQGGIMYLSPFVNGGGLIFYYRVGDDTMKPQVFQIGPDCAYFNHFDHDYSTTSFYAKGKDSVLSPNVAYIQAMGGVKTQLSFPFLANWKKLGHILINEAEVDIPINKSATGSDGPPLQAYLVRDSAGYSFSLPDQSLGTYGGVYDATNNKYVFNIARYIQSVLDGKVVDRGLYLIAGNSAISANGAVLYGTAKNANTPRIRLKIYYTPLKN